MVSNKCRSLAKGLEGMIRESGVNNFISPFSQTLIPTSQILSLMTHFGLAVHRPSRKGL